MKAAYGGGWGGCHAKSELNTIRLTDRLQQHKFNMQMILAVPSSASVIKLISNIFHTYIEEAILNCWRDSSFFFFFKYFFGLFLALLIVQMKSLTGNREWHAAKGPGPGVEPGSAAEPRLMGRARYQLSYAAPRRDSSWTRWVYERHPLVVKTALKGLTSPQTNIIITWLLIWI